MKIKMVGTGAISAKERCACALIDDKILVDCGNGTVKTLLEQGVDVNQISAVLITHLHGDHFLDLPFLILQRRFDLADNELNVYCPVGTADAVAKIIEIAYSDTSDWTILRDKAKTTFREFQTLSGQEVAPGYFVSSHQVLHGNFTPAYGFVVEHDGKSVGFSGDSAYCDAINTIMENSDLAVLDTSFIDGSGKHMGVRDIKALAKRFGKTIVTTHMSSTARDYMEEAPENNVIIPKDGQIIEI